METDRFTYLGDEMKLIEKGAHPRVRSWASASAASFSLGFSAPTSGKGQRRKSAGTR
jgi:hypothetical protein